LRNPSQREAQKHETDCKNAGCIDETDWRGSCHYTYRTLTCSELPFSRSCSRWPQDKMRSCCAETGVTRSTERRPDVSIRRRPSREWSRAKQLASHYLAHSRSCATTPGAGRLRLMLNSRHSLRHLRSHHLFHRPDPYASAPV